MKGQKLHIAVENFLKQFKLQLGLEGIKMESDDLEKLTKIATSDGCQTNPVKLGYDDYKNIFKSSLN